MAPLYLGSGYSNRTVTQDHNDNNRKSGEVVIRSYDQQKDRARVEDLERSCEVGPADRAFLYTDTLGDPICRIRSSPAYKMLVRLCNMFISFAYNHVYLKHDTFFFLYFKKILSSSIIIHA